MQERTRDGKRNRAAAGHRRERRSLSTSGLRQEKQQPRPQEDSAGKRRGGPEPNAAAFPRAQWTGSLTSNAAWGSSSIRASEKLRKNLPGKQRLQQGSLTKERRRGIQMIAKRRKNTHLWAAAGAAAAAAISNSYCYRCWSCFYRGYQLRRRPRGKLLEKHQPSIRPT